MNIDRQDLAEIQKRFEAAEAELQGVLACRAVGNDPAKREGELLDELDALEYEAGLILYPQFRQP
jgi:hypothetical protein